MKILVTGVAGFLGSHLAKALQPKHEILGIDNLIGGYLENVPEGIEFIQMNLNDPELYEVLKHWEPEVIYHCACTAYEGLSVFSPSLVTMNTFQNTSNLLSAAVAAGSLKRFVYLSSMSRYGKQEAPFTESMRPDPEDPYAIAKVASEQLLTQMASTFGFEYVIAVPHNIIGPGQKYDDPFRNVVSIMINRCLQGKAPVIYGDGYQTRCFSFIDDCLFTLTKMLDCPEGIYNIGPDEKDGEVVTINELAREVMEACGVSLEPVYYPGRPREVQDAHCSSDKIRMMFDYKTKTTLKQGIRKMVADIKRKGVRPFDYHLPVEIRNELTPKTWTEKRI